MKNHKNTTKRITNICAALVHKIEKQDWIRGQK